MAWRMARNLFGTPKANRPDDEEYLRDFSEEDDGARSDNDLSQFLPLDFEAPVTSAVWQNLHKEEFEARSDNDLAHMLPLYLEAPVKRRQANVPRQRHISL
jgi:hypothetical protein